MASYHDYYDVFIIIAIVYAVIIIIIIFYKRGNIVSFAAIINLSTSGFQFIRMGMPET